MTPLHRDMAAADPLDDAVLFTLLIAEFDIRELLEAAAALRTI